MVLWWRFAGGRSEKVSNFGGLDCFVCGFHSRREVGAISGGSCAALQLFCECCWRSWRLSPLLVEVVCSSLEECYFGVVYFLIVSGHNLCGCGCVLLVGLFLWLCNVVGCCGLLRVVF